MGLSDSPGDFCAEFSRLESGLSESTSAIISFIHINISINILIISFIHINIGSVKTCYWLKVGPCDGAWPV